MVRRSQGLESQSFSILGIPLPIWSTASGEERVCIGSVEELSNAIDQANKALGLEQSIPGLA